MIDKLSREACCGCNVCSDACPKGAITFSEDNEGFLYPSINNDICIKCNICEKVCPIINIDVLKKNDFEYPHSYAAIHKNLQVRFDSTSGGAFSAFAKKAYAEKAYVGGAIWNKDWSVSQYISNDKNDIEKLRSSKYIQSNAIGFYGKVKELLQAGEKLLLCGTPCQIAALKSYLKKDYENLITLDFICMYVNSPKIWHKYIEFLEEKYNSKVIYIKDKNKEIGWRTLTNKIIFENGKVLYDSKDKNIFRRCYMGLGVASRPSCYNCRFKGFPRIADISVADFWGVEKYLGREFDGNLGTSLILINSKRGESYFDEKVRKSLYYQEIPFNAILSGNPALTVAYKPPRYVNRSQFYEDLEKVNLEKLVIERLNEGISSKVVIKRKIRNLLKFGYWVLKVSKFSIDTWCKNIYYNLFSRQIQNSILDGHILLFHKYTYIDMHKGAKIIVNGCVKLGNKITVKDKSHTLFLIKENGLIKFEGNYAFGAGANVQVFENAEFVVGDGGDTNMNVEIVCGKKIQFEDYVFLGRNVIVRDTNGEHYLSRQGYKTSRPVILGTHAWLCDRCTIMPGVRVYSGGIVGAGAFVTADVPAFTIVSGNPAKVVDEEVYWKN
ncbi:Coenzyme F420 hydrogenase/dehydrogenase, beta subunit C-terminal domain [Phocaeicola sp.]